MISPPNTTRETHPKRAARRVQIGSLRLCSSYVTPPLSAPENARYRPAPTIRPAINPPSTRLHGNRIGDRDALHPRRTEKIATPRITDIAATAKTTTSTPLGRLTFSSSDGLTAARSRGPSETSSTRKLISRKNPVSDAARSSGC